MGAENSVFDSCEWTESLQDGAWYIRHGVSEDGVEISVFTCAQKDKQHENMLRKLTKVINISRDMLTTCI